MNRKTIIICIAVSLLLLGLIGGAVALLYSDVPEQAQTESVSHSALLSAVPGDAAVIMCFQSARTGLGILSDESNCLDVLLGGNPAFRKFTLDLAASDLLKSKPMAISVHYSGTLEPLMVINADKAGADTTSFQAQVLAAASEAGLLASIAGHGDDGYLLISGAETLLDASRRHIESSASILDDGAFSRIASSLSARNVIFLSNNYSTRVLDALFLKPVKKHSQFVRTAADWTAFEIKDASPKHMLLQGRTEQGRSPSYFANCQDEMPAGDIRFPQIAPGHTFFAVSQSVPDFEAWHKQYLKYIDASMRMQKYKAALDTLKRISGINPTDWFKENSVREVTKICWISSSGTSECADLIRTSASRKTASELEAFANAAFVPAVFGGLYDCPGADHIWRSGEWLAIGTSSALSDLSAAVEGSDILSVALGEISQSQIVPSRDCRSVVYYSPFEGASLLSSSMAPVLEASIRKTLESSVAQTMVLSCSEQGLTFEMARSADSDRQRSSSRKPIARKADVEIPQGPFQVQNCGTGKTNLFYQNENKYLCLKDEESGKGLWGVPFDQKICGAVGQIDHLANGKIQFLFCAGSKLYLIDRLGRFVSGFPVDLGKNVLLGPAVTGTPNHYTVMVLHDDNTIGMYDTAGKVPSQWKGITSADTILSLPREAKSDGTKCWVVRTAAGDVAYDWFGGEPLKAKAIKNLEY